VKPTNIKIPRLSKKEFSIQVITPELFERFQKEFPEYKDMKYDFFLETWLEIAQTIRTEGVVNPLGVKLGSYLGEIKTEFLPYKYRATDIQASNQEGEKVHHLNILTRGKVAKIKWERRWAVRFNNMLQFYGYEPHREMNTISHKYIPDNVDKVRVSRTTIGRKRNLS
jgi:hypothetical protein